MIDRKLGYAIVSLIFLIAGAISIYMLRHVFFPPETRIIAFDTIGNLRIDDPVRVKGILSGTIKKITWRKDKVLVFVVNKTQIRFHKGYSIANMDQGVMGDRMLMIDCGDTTAPIISGLDTLKGIFYPGISEAVGYSWKMHEVVDSFIMISSKLLRGTPHRKSLVRSAREIISDVDSLSRVVLKLTGKMQKNVSGQIDSLEAIVNTAALFSRSAAASIPEYITILESQIKKTSLLLSSLDTVSQKLLRLSSNLEKTDNVLWKNDYSLLQERLNTLHKAISLIREHMIQFKIYLGLL